MRVANDVAYCIGEQHSLHLVRDNAGNLIALSAQLCRSGFQSYSAAELGVGGNELVNVYRPKDEVLSAAHLASIEAKSVTLDHPSEFLTPANTNYYRVGHVQNVRRGPDEDGEVTVIGDVHVTDQRAIDRVAQGVRDLSLGYTYELDEGPEPGTYTQRRLRANHCAIVAKGRAGSARIIDRAITGIETVAQFVGRTFEETVQRFHRKNANDVVPHSENKESPMLQQTSTVDEDQIETEEPMDSKQLLDALNAHSAALKTMFDDLKTLMNKPKATDGECNCGGKKSHSDACPLYSERAEDMDENFSERDQNRRGAPELIPLNSNGGGEGNENPVSARDCQEALNNLRTIRHVIADSGDRRAILAYNQAVIEVKKKLADALMRGPERVGPNPQRQAMDEQQASGADFEEQCRNLRRFDIRPGNTEEVLELARKRKAKDAPRRAVDSQREIAESYEDSVKAARTKALKK